MIIASIKRNISRLILVCAATSALSAILSFSLGLLFSTPSIKINTITALSLSLLFIGSIMVHYLAQLTFQSIQLAFIKQSLTSSWHKIIYTSYPAMKKIDPSSLIKALSDLESSLFLMTEKSFILINHTLLILVSFIALSCLHSTLAIAYFLTLLSLLAFKFIFQTRLNHQSIEYLDRQQQADSALYEAFSQIDKIKTAHLELYSLKKWRALFADAKNRLKTLSQSEALISLIDGIAGTVLIILTLYQHAPTILLLCAAQLLLSYATLSTSLLELLSRRATLNQLRLIPDITIRSSPQLPSFHFQGSIQLSNVTFNGLHDITMHIKAGSFVGLTGDSGSGKSTLFRLILGLESGYTGTISLDNINIQSLDLTTARKNIGVVLQTTRLFPGTIYSNITSNMEMTLDDIWELIRLVDLEDEINAMPMKLFTSLSDHSGRAISGGQRQKILIARALASRPTALFLDEATSALDEASQSRIFNNLQLLSITRFVIAHRLNTLEKADKIYNLKDGRVIIVDRK